jgi:hypothetical protein
MGDLVMKRSLLAIEILVLLIRKFLRPYIIRFALYGFLSLCRANAMDQNVDPCGCNAVLVDGVFTFRAEKGDEQARRDILHEVATSTYNEMQKQFSAVGGTSFAGFGLNAGMSQSEFDKKIEALKRIDTESGGHKSSKALLEKYGDRDVLGAWTSCKANCKQDGINSWVGRLDDYRFTLHLKWVPIAGGGSTYPTVEQSSIEGGFSCGKHLYGEVLPAKTEIALKEVLIPIRRGDSAVPIVLSVTLKNSNMDVAEYVPKVIPTLTPTPPPSTVADPRTANVSGN